MVFREKFKYNDISMRKDDHDNKLNNLFTK